jgi:hypothetical protein
VSVDAIPAGLGVRGSRLWTEITALHDLDPAQTAVLEESCRSADRLDELDSIIAGRGVLNLMQFRLKDDFEGDDSREVHVEVTFNSVLAEARQQQTVFKQLLAALRLPDAASGRKPQQRGGARGAYKPTGSAGAKVSSLDRARAKREA